LREAGRPGLCGHVTCLGQRTDVPAILRGCDVGVLSSASEGLPLALIEYGLCRLPAVATRVGQCPDVLDDGRAGLLVPPGSPGPLADAILDLLGSAERRASFAARLARRVRTVYGPREALARVESIYCSVLGLGDGG